MHPVPEIDPSSIFINYTWIERNVNRTPPAAGPGLPKGRYKWLYLSDHILLFAMVAVQGFLGGIIVYGF